MNMHLYPKLAWHGIIKNKKTYVPFLLTSIGLVMMFYIVSYLTYNKSVKQMRGGGDMQLILSWGVPVVAFFVVIFLFYMNSFLMRRRKTEFGLYNILGMGKGNIARVLLWQNLMLFAVSIVGGLGMGILLSKLAELCAAKMLSNQASLAFVIEPSAVRNTLFLTALSFVLILLYSLGQIRVAKPIELLHGEKTGEKPPKARWILALLGMLLLGTAYYLALTTKDPIQALLVLFIAIAGSKPADGSIPGFAAVAVRLLIWAICIGLFIGAAVLLRLLHVRYRQNVFLDTRHPRQAVHAMYRYLFRLLRWTGLRFRQEPLLEFCEKAVQHLRQQKLPATAPEQIIPMILAMEFGKQDPEMAEQRQAAAEASALADAIFKRCNPLKRFCMKYLLHLI